ncbi:MAG: hypothetical protein RLZZ381_3518 [Cyanobacteriota bacterium]|jgi:hypothetical protein
MFMFQNLAQQLKTLWVVVHLSSQQNVNEQKFIETNIT